MHLSNSPESPEHVVLVMGRRGATVLSGVLATLVLALGAGIAFATLMYH